MRLLGHPVHVMLVHFPVALWPAHAALHFFASYLPAGVSGVGGFWLLVGGVVLGWLAALCGLADVLALARDDQPRQLARGLWHGGINGAVLLAFTALAAMEYTRYPNIRHGGLFLAGEIGLLGLMSVGNYIGGALIWGPAGSATDAPSVRSGSFRGE